MEMQFLDIEYLLSALESCASGFMMTGNTLPFLPVNFFVQATIAMHRNQLN